MDKKGNIKKRKKLRIKPIIITLITIIIIILIILFIKNQRIKRIEITGNDIVKDVEIITAVHIEDYPKIYSLKLKDMEKEINNLPLINNAKVKRNIFGKLTITVTEDKVFLYNEYTKKYVTSSNEELEINKPLLGIPSLINFTPDTVLSKFIDSLNKVDYNVIRMISEIEYSPYTGLDGTIVDDSRFILKMNDQNTVVIDTVNIKNLNQYMRIYASLNLDETKGILYLDTITEENIYFKTYEEVVEEPIEGEEPTITE